MHQLTRRTLPLEDAPFKEFDDALRDIDSAAGESSRELVEKAEAVLSSIQAHPPGHMNVMKRYWVRYATLAGLLLVLEIASLLWLVSPSRGAIAPVVGTLRQERGWGGPAAINTGRERSRPEWTTLSGLRKPPMVC
ncbi:hypothetical protein [Streptomyces sp. NPDC000877]|uniref:hypothetical protein n=1 Tax=unclassified Streptomyces TaxID=2593676 RepID=UPI0033199CF8